MSGAISCDHGQCRQGLDARARLTKNNGKTSGPIFERGLATILLAGQIGMHGDGAR